MSFLFLFCSEDQIQSLLPVNQHVYTTRLYPISFENEGTYTWSSEQASRSHAFSASWLSFTLQLRFSWSQNKVLCSEQSMWDKPIINYSGGWGRKILSLMLACSIYKISPPHRIENKKVGMWHNVKSSLISLACSQHVYTVGIIFWFCFKDRASHNLSWLSSNQWCKLRTWPWISYIPALVSWVLGL